MTKRLSIIIVNWNTPEILLDLLNRLEPHPEIETIVIDNCSRESLDNIEKKFGHVRFFKNTINHGYSFACNQGAVKAVGEWLLFLNPDVSITTQQALELLNDTIEKQFDASSPDIGQSGYQKPLTSFLSLVCEFTPLGKFFQLKSSKRTLFGGCILIKKNILYQIGCWDERFFLWFEDSDLTRRLYENGFKVGWIESNIQHEGAKSFVLLESKVKRQIFFHSLIMYSEKYFNAIQKVIIKIICRRFASNILLPSIDDSITLTVPNMRRDLLDSFLQSNAKFIGKTTELIIVTSSIKPFQFIEYKKNFPNVRFIIINRNLGFAKTVNTGLRLSRGDWAGTSNDDTVWESDWVSDCLAVATNNTGSINPVIYDSKGGIESSGITVLPNGRAIPIVEISKSDLTVTDATNGAAVMYRQNALEKVGIFDELFVSYLEDIDISLRLARNGFKNHVATKVKIVHIKHQTTQSKPSFYKTFHDFKNWILILIKNWTPIAWRQFLPQIILERIRNFSGIIKSLLPYRG